MARILKRVQEPVDKVVPGDQEKILARGSMVFPVHTVVDEIAVPFIRWIGLGWSSGQVGPT